MPLSQKSFDDATGARKTVVLLFSGTEWSAIGDHPSLPECTIVPLSLGCGSSQLSELSSSLVQDFFSKNPSTALIVLPVFFFCNLVQTNDVDELQRGGDLLVV